MFSYCIVVLLGEINIIHDYEHAVGLPSVKSAFGVCYSSRCCLEDYQRQRTATRNHLADWKMEEVPFPDENCSGLTEEQFTAIALARGITAAICCTILFAALVVTIILAMFTQLRARVDTLYHWLLWSLWNMVLDSHTWKWLLCTQCRILGTDMAVVCTLWTRSVPDTWAFYCITVSAWVCNQECSSEKTDFGEHYWLYHLLSCDVHITTSPNNSLQLFSIHQAGGRDN